MNLDQIQSNLQSILQGITALASVPDRVLVDDNNQLKPMEDALDSEGLVILIMQPQALRIISQGIGSVSMEYVCTLWIRTNPKVQVSNAPKWEPLSLEKVIIPAVLQFGMAPSIFKISEGMEPETDFTDIGNNSRLIRFSTPVILQ